MGRKGMKGFMKSAARPSNKAEEAEAEEAAAQASAAADQPQQQKQQPAAAPAAKPAAAQPAAAAAAGGGGAGDDAEGGAHGAETRGQMLQRHKREMLAHKKAVQRTGKKSKDELTKLDAEITARHAEELAALDAAAAAAPPPAAAAVAAQATAAADGSAAAADRASKYLKDLSVDAAADDDEEGDEGGGKGKKLTKAQKRREKQAAKDAEREARIAAELAELGPSERATEEAALEELLLPLGLGIQEIRADGHCLYRSLEDQLQQMGGDSSSSSSSFQELRQLAAEYIRQHRDQFAPFLLPEDEGQDPAEYYESYCDTLESTAAWGGHLELTALSAALKRHIRVHAVGMDTINIGDAEHAAQPPLEICYLRHAFGLGEHYNSTRKLLFAGGGGAGGEQQEEGGSEEEEEDEHEV